MLRGLALLAANGNLKASAQLVPWDKALEKSATDDVLALLQPIWLAKPETASRVRGRIERIN